MLCVGFFLNMVIIEYFIVFGVLTIFAICELELEFEIIQNIIE